MPSVIYDHYIFFCKPCFELWPSEQADKLSLSAESADCCPNCGQEISAVPEESWMAAMVKLQHLPPEQKRLNSALGGVSGVHTGPLTPEAKHRVSMNGRIHGRFAKKHLLPAARHGRLKDCETCPFASSDTNSDGNGRCLTEKFLYCVKQLDTMVAFINAHHGGGAKALADMMASAQGMSMINLSTALQQVAAEGPTVERRRTITRYNNQGQIASEEETTEIEAHPALISIQTHGNLLGTRLADFNLTPKSTGESDRDTAIQDAVRGLFEKFTPAPSPLQISSE